MSDTSTALAPAQSRQAIQAKTAARPHRVTGKLKTACDLMVWGDESGKALPWNEAAHQADYNIRSMRLALEKQHVRQYLKEQRDVFCASAGAANISRAIELRQQDDNKTAAIQAIRLLEDMAADRPGASGMRVTTPGIVIQINNVRTPLMADQSIIEVNPLIDNETVSDDDGNRGK